MKIDTNFFKIIFILISLFLFSVPNSYGQVTVRVDEQVSPDNIVIFYIGDFDFTNASSNPLIFQYRISADDTVEVVMVLRMTATVPGLGLTNEQILFAETNPFTITAPITISNRDIDENTSEIFDEAGNSVDFSVDRTEQLDSDTQKDLTDQVTQSGKLPAGLYTFELLVTSTDASDPPTIYSFENPKIIDISNPTTLDLVGPGGYLSEEFEIFTLFPIFQWESQGCEYGIRVSEYNPAIHSSVEEALNDVSNLPFPDDGSYFAGDGGEGLLSTTLQYPLTGAKLLEYGKTYVWSVKKTCVTTGGDEERNSDIYAFKIADITGEGDDSGAGITGGVITDPVLAALQSIFGDLFEGLFSGDGELAGYTTVAGILLNGETVTAEAVSDFAEKLLSGEVGSIRIEIQ